MADKKGNRYSVYQGLDSDPSINWGTVASTISKQLTLLKETKVAERDAIDKETQNQMDQLNKLPDVNDRSLSKIVLEASDRSKEYLRREMALVKRGLRKPKDYSLFMQSQKNGYSDFGNVVKNWDKWNTAKQEAITNGTQSELDMFTAEDIESFGNLKNKTVMTNPANGQLQVVSMQKDKDGNFTVMPNAGKNPEAFANPGSINSRMSFDEKKKDTTALVSAETAEIAKIVEAGRAANGVVTTMEDYRQSPSFDTWKRETTAKLTSNVYDTTQVLTQSGYVLGRTEAEARKKWESQYGTGEDAKPFDASKFIKVNMSGEKPVPQLSDSQVNEAKEIVGNKIESQLDSIQEKSQGFKDTKDDNDRKDKEANIVGFLDEMNTVLSDTDKVKSKQILDRRIANKNKELKKNDSPLITDVDITDNEIVVYYADGTSQPTKRSNTKDDSYAIFNFLSPEAGDDISTPVLDKYAKDSKLNFGESNIKTRDQIRKDYPELLPEDKKDLKLKNPDATDAQLLQIKQEQLYQENTLSSKSSQKPVEYIKGGNVLNSEGAEVSADSFVQSELGSNIQASVDPPEQVQKEMVRLLGADGFLPVDGAGNSVFKEGDISVTINGDKRGLTFKIGSTTFSIDKMYPMKTDAMITQLQNAVEREVKKINETRTGTKGRRQRAKETDTSKYNI